MTRVTIPSELMTRVAAGEEKAFEELFRLTYRPLFSFLLSLTADQEKASDLMQETYLRVYISAGRYKDFGNPMAWIMKIGKNLFLMDRRKKENSIIYVENPGEVVPEIPFDSISDIEARETLRILFEILTPQERTIVTLHEISGFRNREIAELLELPIGTVLSKYYRAIGKMKKKAQEEGFTGEGDRDEQ